MGGNRQNLISKCVNLKQYKVILSKDAVQDIKEIKQYILRKYKYREYAENFSEKIKLAIKTLELFTKAYKRTGFNIDGHEVLYKPYNTYLIFYIVDDENVIVIRILKDRMYWQPVIERMKKINL